MNILSKDILSLKTSQKFSSVLEPYAVKVASTVLRRGCHCEVMFLSDIILTDSNYRWDEINSSLNLKNNDSLWNDLETCINSFEYYLDNNQEYIFNLRNTGKLAPLRNIMKKIYLSIKNDNKISPQKVIEEKLKLEYMKAYKSAMKEIPNSSEHSFNVKFKCLIPNGGIAHKNVQRMLLSSGIEKFLNNVPMAIFIEKL